MKKIGIIGGLGPESTLDYYRGIIDAFIPTYEKKGYPEISIESIQSTYHPDGLILGCTELPLIIKPEDVSMPYLNTSSIHISKIVAQCKA